MKYLKRTTIIILLISFMCLCVINSAAHSLALNVSYDQCSVRWVNSTQYAIEDGIEETWYFMGNSSIHLYHIDQSVKNLKYYFAANDTSVDALGLSDETINEIKTAFVNSMKKWNDIYYYTYDSNGNATANQIIQIVEGSQNDYNIMIKLKTNMKDPSRAVAQSENYNPDENDDCHHHYNKWLIEIDVNYFYVHDQFSIGDNEVYSVSADVVSSYRERTGQHEVGHILGLVDIDDYCSTIDAIDAPHHQELLMGDGDSAMTRATYKDIAGVSITRGFHTDDDHKWMIRTRNDGSQYLICSLCNGIRTEYELDEDGTYEGQTPVVYGSCNDNHSLAGGNMLLVATDGTRDFYKCLKCRYIEEVDHSHRYTHWAPYSKTEHKEMCVCGWLGTNTAGHVIRSTDVVGRSAPCIGCGYPVIIDPFGPPGQIIHNVQKVSVNGSYILPNGIIVLVDEDVEAYENGTLVFYDKNNLPEMQ